MSTVFLIGNGFDLSCGMKTRYTDVYNSYCQLQDSDSDVIKQFKKDISSSYENWSDFEEGMAEYAKNLDSEDTFIECIKDFRNYLQNFLKQEENRFYETINIKEDLKPLLIEEMRKSLFEYYLGSTPRVSNIVKEINKREIDRLDCISFNYTSVFDNLMKLAFNTKNTFHIHGQLDDYLIMGMDNENQISTNYTLTQRGKQTFVKTIFNDEFDPTKMKTAKDKIVSADIICAFGLSLRDSDLTWRNAIINSLTNYKDHHLFLFDYQLACEQSLLQNDKLDSEYLKRNEILKTWGIQNPDSYINKIHIPCGFKIFNFVEIIENYNSNSGKR